MNAPTKSGTNQAPRQTTGTPPTKPAGPEAAANAAAAVSSSPPHDQGPGLGGAIEGGKAREGSEFVTKADLGDFAARILAGFEDRMAKRERVSAQNVPVQIRETFSAEDLVKDRHMDIPVDGTIEGLDRPDLVIERGEVEDAAVAAMKGRELKRAMLKFMAEMVCVNVSESTNPNDQAVFPLSVNGSTIYVTRGVNTWMRRYYVESLCRAKPADYKITVVKNQDGDVVNRATRSSALANPFTVIEDRNPRGRAWITQLLREG